MSPKKFTIVGITFVFPVLVILFLHYFGENKYNLPNIGKWQDQCVVPENKPLVVINRDLYQENRYRDHINLAIDGLLERIDSTSVIDLTYCTTDTLEGNVVLIDSKLTIRGQYDIKQLEEADRLHTEIDILLTYD